MSYIFRKSKEHKAEEEGLQTKMLQTHKSPDLEPRWTAPQGWKQQQGWATELLSRAGKLNFLHSRIGMALKA